MHEITVLVSNKERLNKFINDIDSIPNILSVERPSNNESSCTKKFTTSVSVDSKIIGSIEHGLVVLVGFTYEMI